MSALPPPSGPDLPHPEEPAPNPPQRDPTPEPPSRDPAEEKPPRRDPASPEPPREEPPDEPDAPDQPPIGDPPPTEALQFAAASGGSVLFGRQIASAPTRCEPPAHD